MKRVGGISPKQSRGNVCRTGCHNADIVRTRFATRHEALQTNRWKAPNFANRAIHPHQIKLIHHQDPRQPVDSRISPSITQAIIPRSEIAQGSGITCLTSSTVVTRLHILMHSICQPYLLTMTQLIRSVNFSADMLTPLPF